MQVTDNMVNRFLCWKLPHDFAPDCGISFDGRKDDEWNKNKTWPVGTNLLTAIQARAMLEHVLAEPVVQPHIKTAAEMRYDAAHDTSCVGNCASAAAKEYWERGHWVDKANAAKLRHPLYAAQTMWNACAQAGAIEREKLDPLLRRSLAQLRKWAEWYGKADHAARRQLPLPPAGDVELAEDISTALGPNVI